MRTSDKRLIMRFSCCLQSVGRALALPPRTAGGGDTRSLARPAMGDLMRSLLYVIAIMVVTSMLRVPLLAQENSVEVPTQAPPVFSTPRFVVHRNYFGF